MSEHLQVAGSTAAMGRLALLLFRLRLRRAAPRKGERRRLAPLKRSAWGVPILAFGVFCAGGPLAATEAEAPVASTPSASMQAAALPRFDIELACGLPPPGEDSELARLFQYAEDHEGSMVQVNLQFHPGTCSCPGPQAEAPVSLALGCEHNPDWWLAERMKQYTCVQSRGLAGHHAGVGSLCFPPHDLLPLKAGYAREQTATHQRISGPFLLNWEWSLGAPQVQLLLPE